MTDLVGRPTRGVFRDLMTDSTVGAINTAFKTKASRAIPTAATKTAASVAGRHSHTWMRSTGPTRDRSPDFSGSPNGCSMAGSRSASAIFTIATPRRLPGR
jgi:hypothetical protein